MREAKEKEKVRISFGADGKNISEQAYKKKVKGNDSWKFYLGFIGEIGFTIAIPIVLGALIGSYVDKRFFWYPKATMMGLIFGIIVSVVNLLHTLDSIIKKK